MHYISNEYHTAPSVCRRVYLADGKILPWDGAMQEVVSPVASGGKPPWTQVIGTAPLLTPDAALEAVAAARRAYDNGRGAWPTLPVAERVRRVRLLVSALETQRHRFAHLLMWEIGKPQIEALREVDRTIRCINDSVAALEHMDRSSSPVNEQGFTGLIRRGPLGVVLCMGPYNFPLYETFTNLVPALLMGNTAVIKPPRFGVLLFHHLLEPLQEAFPPGVVNILYGNSEVIIPAVMQSGNIDVFAFIGTSRVADALRCMHPHPHRLRCILGLDAKNPAIVLPDADLDLAVEECVSGSLTFNGQRCTALKILFVHRSVADEFNARMAVAIENLCHGNPWEDNVTITPLPEPEKHRYLTELVNDAVAKGANIVNRGGGVNAGAIFRPALLYPVSPKMRVYHEEQFGPVVPVVPFDDIAEVIDYVTTSPYGQQASIFSRSSDAITPLLDALATQVCRINLNCQCQRGPDSFPFNGRKNSAEGIQSVAEALRIFSIRTVVATRSAGTNETLIGELAGGKSLFLSDHRLS